MVAASPVLLTNARNPAPQSWKRTHYACLDDSPDAAMCGRGYNNCNVHYSEREPEDEISLVLLLFCLMFAQANLQSSAGDAGVAGDARLISTYVAASHTAQTADHAHLTHAQHTHAHHDAKPHVRERMLAPTNSSFSRCPRTLNAAGHPTRR